MLFLTILLLSFFREVDLQFVENGDWGKGNETPVKLQVCAAASS